MPQIDRGSVPYTFGFAAVVCLVCAVVVSSAAVVLKPARERNQRVDRLMKVLEVAGLVEQGERLSAEEVVQRFEASVVPRVVALSTGEVQPEVDASSFDPRRAAKDPQHSVPAPQNAARVSRVPHNSLVYEVRQGSQVTGLVLPISGYGLWSTLYGYLSLEADGQTVSGITFYEHGETPGLGGEVENPKWQARWQGRKVYGDDGNVKLQVIKGAAGPSKDDPYQVDGLSGATITSRGVSHTIAFWLGPHGFGPYLARYKQSAAASAELEEALQ